jgi:hypothetical protein
VFGVVCRFGYKLATRTALGWRDIGLHDQTAVIASLKGPSSSTSIEARQRVATFPEKKSICWGPKKSKEISKFGANNAGCGVSPTCDDRWAMAGVKSMTLGQANRW